jgi:hypothetical protein
MKVVSSGLLSDDSDAAMRAAVDAGAGRTV